MSQRGNTMNTRVVIVGAGFGGLSAAKALAGSGFDVTIIDQHNYHLFQPLLYQVATAGLSPAEIASPIRSILARARNVNVILGKVSGVDVARRTVIAEGRHIPFDHLILATGAQHAYFGHDDWAASAPGLKTIDDATYIRRRILLAFEKAETEEDPHERARLLNFVIVGGGPTGVEMAGAIAELANRALAADFRAIDPRAARIILVEAAPRLLTPFDPSLSEAAKRSLEQLGVTVRLGAAVTAVDAEGVSIGAERIEARTVIWGAGVTRLARGPLARRRDRPRRPRQGCPRSVGAGRAGHLRDRRHRGTRRRGRQAPARCRAGRQAARLLRRQTAAGAPARPDASAVPLPRFRLARDNRAQARRRPDGTTEARGLHRLAHLVRSHTSIS